MQLKNEHVFKNTINLDQDVICSQLIMEEEDHLHLEHYTLLYVQADKDKEWNFTINCN